MKKIKPQVLWFTGLSGSGKTTIANKVSQLLKEQNHDIVVLDGDDIRTGLCCDLGFSDNDRQENNRRIAEVAKLFIKNGNIVLVTFISPYQEVRDKAKEILGVKNFSTIYVDTDIEKCIERDVKGLYKKAMSGEIPQFTGISDRYDIPKHPELILDGNTTSDENIIKCAKEIIEYLKHKEL